MDTDKLVTMLNQIAAFHRRKTPEEAAVEVAAHVQKFWERRMKQAAYARLDAGGEGMEPNVAAGLALLRAREVGAPVGDPGEVAALDAPLEA